MTPATSVDGRTARRLSNRARIVDAALDLAASGTDLTVEGIAEAAQVSVRSVYNHFPTVRDLVAGMYERGTERVVHLLDGLPSADVPLAERTVAWSRRIASVLEEIEAVRWRAAVAEERHPGLQPELRALQRAHRDAVRDTFPELDPTGHEAVTALTDPLGWRVLRRHQGLSVEQATQVLEKTIRTLTARRGS